MMPLTNIPVWLDLIIAFIIGTGFGFALEQAGFSSCRKLTGMFYGYDTTVIKVFFTAAIVALTGSQLLDYLGILDLKMVFVNEYLVYASIIGGIIMGAGFIMGGFCPGTGLAALSTGKIDAMVFAAGGLTGAWLFAESYPLIQNIAEGNNKGPVKINEVLGLQPGSFTLLLIIAAAAMFLVAEKAETRFRRPEITNDI
ncbi:MAG TPA: YeeE/YedE thiosulfate transporter family protein [Bacteroidales bacterium]|nr:YeeE/YedE thiosulfate transporter family protein [Bacteroidales bacterium]